MKPIIYLTLAIITFFTGCTTIEKKQISDSELHGKLVGTWEGETIRKDGYKKEWVQVRFPDGRYQITFKFYEGDFVSWIESEKGTWWIENGRFCEQFSSYGSTPFVYELEWLDDNCIKMKSIKRDPSGDEYEGYTFSECRKMM